MPSSPVTEAASGFICECTEEWMHLACKGFPFFKEHEGKRYCVLHYPNKDKVTAFNEALKKKLEAEDFNFCGVWFPSVVDFEEFTFTKPADFLQATFTSVVYFFSATFVAKANFRVATFNWQANFQVATFQAEADFSFAKFGKGAYFSNATFKDYVRFAGKDGSQVITGKSSLDLQFAGIEKPDHLSFHTVTLRPHWFVNVDARKFEFINVDWDWRSVSVRREVESLKREQVSSPHRLLAIACRNLAINAEENHRYEEASKFRYMAMDARRLEHLLGFAPWTLGWWYWLASGYGERVWRALVMLIGVWLVAAALYTQVGFVRWEPKVSSEQEAAEAKRDEVGRPLMWPRALTYSLGVMTLQKPEPRPATDAAQAVVMLETILGPVQAALLALAIRRKFMR